MPTVPVLHSGFTFMRNETVKYPRRGNTALPLSIEKELSVPGGTADRKALINVLARKPAPGLEYVRTHPSQVLWTQLLQVWK
jgi:hypothetical protein